MLRSFTSASLSNYQMYKYPVFRLNLKYSIVVSFTTLSIIVQFYIFVLKLEMYK